MKRLGWFLRRGWILLAIANAASAGWCNSVSIGETAGYPGKTVSLPVVIDTSAPCAGLNLWLEYDSGILGSPGVFPGEILTGAHEVLFSSPEAGKLNIVVVDPSGASTFSALSGTALYLTFVIEGSALDQSFSDISYAPMVQGPLFIFPAGMSNVTGESLSIVSQTPGRVTISLARVPDRWVEGYGPGAGYSHEQHIRLLADVNGNGMEDIVAFGNPGVQVAVSTGSAFQHGGWWDRLMSYDNAWRVEKHPRLAADMNGDGMADIVGFGDRGGFMGFSTGSGFTAPALQVLGFGYRDGWRVRDEVNSGTYDLDEIWTAAEQFCLAQQFTGQYVEHPRGAFDINGDGALDIAGFGPGGVTVALNNGDGTFQDAS
ncbi:VCBS repeat-containing protein, partial [bacterium]|nr:VCBS repeat-containing protein [bacterium]